MISGMCIQVFILHEKFNSKALLFLRNNEEKNIHKKINGQVFH